MITAFSSPFSFTSLRRSYYQQQSIQRIFHYALDKNVFLSFFRFQIVYDLCSLSPIVCFGLCPCSGIRNIRRHDADLQARTRANLTFLGKHLFLIKKKISFLGFHSIWILFQNFNMTKQSKSIIRNSQSRPTLTLRFGNDVTMGIESSI